MRHASALIAVLWLCLLLPGCGPGDPVFHPDQRPQRLSDWNLFRVSDNALALNPATLRFKPANTLFTDYAHKLRSLWIPEGQQIGVKDNELDYPVGTILSKTFYYPLNSAGLLLVAADDAATESVSLEDHRLLETRLLVRRDSGWDAFSYVWNEEQTEAFLRVAGASLPVALDDAGVSREFAYFVPNENQCSGCHQTEHPDGGIHPLGAIASQLNHGIPDADGDTGNQLQAMAGRSWLPVVPETDAMPGWEDERQPLDLRARAYLDMNCGHCHNPAGPADTSALLLNGISHNSVDMGLCKPPIAAGGGSGDRQFGIVPGQPDQSILLYRMESTNPGTMMPELGRSLVHREGVELIGNWIRQLAGRC